ncbi:hypothetical protein ACIO93_41815 [Streptomyces sp. NPDC087903]|uniref:hypothetical protein n=1 Tax=Streptomyces sp. NPDC087903 TaxID=3365819 RepID=UPI00381CC1CA
MSWTRGPLTALTVCVLLLTGSVGCDSGDAPERRGESSGAPTAAVGRLLDKTDREGRRYREVEDKGAPGVGIEVEPDTHAGWDVRLTVDDFRFSPADARAKAVPGRGYALLFVDGRAVASLRAPGHHLPAGYLPHGTHHVTARLYADDDTVWAVDGEPVESTADVTASGAEPSTTAGHALSAPGTHLRTEGRGSPDRGGEAS